MAGGYGSIAFMERGVLLRLLFPNTSGKSIGKLTVPGVVGVNHWVIIAIVWIVFVLLLSKVEKKNL
jgi:hypothetical protein